MLRVKKEGQKYHVTKQKNVIFNVINVSKKEHTIILKDTQSL